MKSVMLSPTDQVRHKATHKVIITYVDLAALAAAATGVIQIFPDTAKFTGATFPAGTQIGHCSAQLVTPFDFSDAGITSLTLAVGITGGDTDKYLEAMELAADGSYVSYKTGPYGTSPVNETTADTVDCLFTAANGGSPLVSEATAGEVHIYLHCFATPAKMQKVTDSLAVA